MGCLSSQCSSRTRSMFRKAPRATLAAKRRFSQTTPEQKPIALPSKPNPNILPTDSCRFPGKPPNTPRHAPRVESFKALRTDSLRNGVRDLPFRNASRPERAPSSPEFRTFRPYLTSDFDHSRKPTFASLPGRLERLCSLDHLHQITSVTVITAGCERGHTGQRLRSGSASTHYLIVGAPKTRRTSDGLA
jgi:hypothetical protein